MVKFLRVVPADFVTSVPAKLAPIAPFASVRASDPYDPLRPEDLFRPEHPAAGSKPRFATTFRPREAFGVDSSGYHNR